MAEQQCHVHTIARVIGVDDRTLTDHFSKLINQKRAEGRAKLHKEQYTAALDGDRTMLVWLGKNALGQTDKSQVESSTTVKLYATEAPVDEV